MHGGLLYTAIKPIKSVYRHKKSYIYCNQAVFCDIISVVHKSKSEDTAMNIRKAKAADIDAIEKIYDDIHTAEENKELTTGWIRGVYPVRATAEAGLQRGDLYVCNGGRRTAARLGDDKRYSGRRVQGRQVGI